MEVKRVKTVRFDVLVKESGRPEQATLWTKAEDDPEFMKAVKGGRVVTVIQHNVGTKKDHGVVGFVMAKNAAYLVFPKRIGAATDSKVVGINYDRVLSGGAKGPIFKPRKQGAPGIPLRERRNYLEASEETEERQLPKTTKTPKRARERFAATVELIGRQQVTVEVEAESKAKAKKLLKARAAEIEMDINHAVMKRRIKTMRKVSGR